MVDEFAGRVQGRCPSAPMRRFRSAPWMRWLAALGPLLAALAAWQIHAAEGWSPLALLAAALAPFFLLGFLDALTAKVELHPGHLLVVQHLRKRSFPRHAFRKAGWDKGGPAALQFASGEWLRLPPVGPSNQGLANSLRAWLGRAEAERSPCAAGQSGGEAESGAAP